MDNTIDRFFKAIGVVFTEQKPVGWWIQKVLDEGKFYYRKTNDITAAAAFYDFGRGMEFAVYLALPKDFEKQPAASVEIDVYNFLPVYRAEETTELTIDGFLSEPNQPIQFWCKAKSPSGLELTGFMVNFIEKAEKVHNAKHAKMMVSGLVLEVGGLVAQGEKEELAICPEPGSPTLLRGVVESMQQTANFQTGEPVYKIKFKTGGMTFDLIAHKDTIKSKFDVGDRVDLFAYIEMFIA